MEPINRGGPAFPVDGFQFKNKDGSEGFVLPMEGMTLRDYFAAAALQGCLASFESTGTRDALASNAYAYADAMLKARDGK